MQLFERFAAVHAITDWRKLRLQFSNCPLCGPSLFVRLGETEWAIRCVRCGAAPATLSLVSALRVLRPELHRLSVYELSARGPLWEYLRRRSGEFTCSEYYDDVLPGTYRNGVQCQDVQRLSFPNDRFDVCTSTEVFEHVVDDEQGFSELWRVLKPGGLTLLTVPLSCTESTIERASLVDGRVIHHQPPEYHNDHLRGRRQVLAFRTYGRDIVERLTRQGFAHVEIVPADPALWWRQARAVVVAYKAPI